jgi:hypothetical protein
MVGNSLAFKELVEKENAAPDGTALVVVVVEASVMRTAAFS